MLFGNPMSRIGRQPIDIPNGVTVSQEGDKVIVRGPKGELSHNVHNAIGVAVENNQIICSIARNTKQSNALWGTTRAVLANMVKGVTDGFQKKLELHGVGYRASLKGKNLEMTLGYSHPVLVPAPEGITFTVEKEVITVEGYDPVKVGQLAADIRDIRSPEPYKGKGVRYQGEKIRRKVGKVVGSGSE